VASIYRGRPYDRAVENVKRAPAGVWLWIGLNATLIVTVAIPGGAEFDRGWVPAIAALLLWSFGLLRRWRLVRVLLLAWSLVATLAIAALVIRKDGGPADGYAILALLAGSCVALMLPSTRRWFEPHRELKRENPA